MIKIKLGIADSNRLYLDRFTKLIERKYKNQIEIYSFSDPEAVPQAVKDNKINVLMVSQDMDISSDSIAEFCMFSYLSDSAQIDTYNGQKTICKYRRIELIYRQILGLYSEKLADKVRYRVTNKKRSHISLFMSVCEGAGATTAAAAFAERLADSGKKTLFLNLKQFRDTKNIFSASGEGSFTDVIFAVKSRKVNMTLKLESIVKQSVSGVYFYDTCTNPLDQTEMKESELRLLIDELSGSFGYDNIVIVSDFFFTDKLAMLLEYSSDIIIVSGDSRMSKDQLLQRTGAIEKLEKRKQISISDKLGLIFNKTKYVKTFSTDIPVLGIHPELETADEREIVRSFAASEIFDRICMREETV